MRIKKILVTDGANKNSLAVVRSLGRKGYHIEVSTPFPRFITLSSYSKYCKRAHVINCDLSDADVYAEKLLSIVKKGKFDLLIPVGLKSYYAVSKHRLEFMKITKTVVPKWDSMQIAYNKDKTMEFANKLGIPIPQTKVLQSINDIDNEISYPVVIKSSDDSGGFVQYCNNRVELLSAFKRLSSISKTAIILQDYIDGFGCGFYGVYDEGKLIAHFMHKRIQEYPITGGPSAIAESYFNEKLFEYGKKTCDNLSWHGPIMVEFKYDLGEQDFKIIEINPKLWGSLDLTIAAGIDVPEILVKIANGDYVTTLGEKYEFVRYKWLFPDLFNVLLSKFTMRTMKEFFNNNTDHIKTNIDLSDPLPTLFQITRTFIQSPQLMFNGNKKYPHGRITK